MIYPGEKTDGGFWEIKGVTIRLGYAELATLRRCLAEDEGFDLMSMEGFGDGERPWDEVDSRLKPFLGHEDDGGSINPTECFEVYPTMERILEGWRRNPPEGINDRIINFGVQIVEAMKLCSKNGWELVFA
jgi:hypothetical protein